MRLPALLLAATFSAPAAASEPAAERLAALAREVERDRRDPRALVLLAELRGLEDELPDLPQAAAVYARAAGDREAHPEVRAWARLLLVEVDRSRGALQKAQAELARLAFVEDWLAIGPFDNEGKRGHDTAYPPEREQDLAARLPGKARDVRWRPVPPEVRRLGFVDLGATMRPVKETVAYALAVLDSPREQRVRLHLGASGAAKLWVNGQLALSDAGYHPARPDQLAAAVTLRRGPNRVLVKLCNEDGRMGFMLRVASPSGEPLRLPSALSPLPPPQRPSPERPEPVPTLLSLLERRAQALDGGRGKGPVGAAAAARARLDLAVAHAEKQSADARDRRALSEARRAAQLAPGLVEAHLLAARLEPDGNRALASLEAALAADPGRPATLLALGVHHQLRGRPFRAIPLLEQAAQADPGPAPRLALADAWDAAGNPGRATRLRADAARDFPLLPGPALAHARAARALERMDEAAALLRKVLALRFDEGAARSALEGLLADRGEVDDALRLLDEAIRLEPAHLGVRLRQADLLAANGRPAEAEAAFAAAERICPEEDEVKERRGRARLRAGRTADAVADFQAALELRPQNPQLKELLRAVQPERERFERPYLLDAAALAADWQAGRARGQANEPARARAAAEGGSARPGAEARPEHPGTSGELPPPDPEEDAVVLGELKVTKVYPSGLASHYQQLVVKVLTARGAEAFRRHTFGYAPGRQEIRVDRARVVKPDGTALEGAQEGDRSASEPWYRLWYDTRVRTASLPALAEGDLLELGVRTDDVASENLLSDYFGDVVYLSDQNRTLRWEYVLLMPPGRPLHASDPPAGVARSQRRVDGALEHRWSARDVPRIRPEPGMPGWSEVSPFVHVSTYASWDDVGRFWWGLVREQLQPDAELRETAERMAGEVRAARRARGEPEGGDARALVEAVHAFVVTSTRYVGLEIGIHGFKPYRVDEVLSRRFGDCKDKASLTYALLQALGIDSRLVLLRMRRMGAMPEVPASLSVFNHAILYVPAFDLWLDGTAAFHGTRDLPGEDREASALVVDPSGRARYQRVPAARAEDNLTESRVEVRLAGEGSAALEGESRIRGASAPGYRRAYQAENDRRATLEQAFSRTFPGVTVRGVQISDLSRLEEDVVVRFQLEQPRFAERDGDRLAFLPFGSAQGYAEAYAASSTRRHDLVIGDPSVNRFRYRVALPDGYAVAELPPPARGETPAAAFQLESRVEGGALVAEGHVTFKQARVAVGEYPALRELVLQLDRALGRKVVLRRTQQARAARAPGQGSAP